MQKNLLFAMKSLLKTVKVFILISMFSFSANAQSGTALSFDGTNDYVALPDILTPSYTKEAWIFAPMSQAPGNNNNIVSGDGATAFWFPSNAGFRLTAGHNVFPFANVQDPDPLLANTWYHVAVTYDAATTTMNLYKNGVLVDSDPAVPVASAEAALNIGRFITSNYYLGRIDEVRIWSEALTQAEIRDWMVRKLDNTHPSYANLIGYYPANEGSGTTLGDNSANTNDGTLMNGTAWVTSGASLGDNSVHDYVNVTKSATIVYAATGESFTATSTSGTPDGIHVYVIESAPTVLTGTSGVGGNDKYFGVFQVGGTAPEYTAVYDYGTNYGPNEFSLVLYERTNNADATWADAGATQDGTLNTLTVTGQVGVQMEYVMGSSLNPLPVNFLSFNLQKERNGVRLNWSTASEMNNSGFYVERSIDGGNTWKNLGFVAGDGNSSVVNYYTFLDENPFKGTNLYRLKQLDLDGAFTYSDVKPFNHVPENSTRIYPIPASSGITLETSALHLNSEAVIYNAKGLQMRKFVIKNLQEQVNISDLGKGIYFIQLADGTSHQFIKM